MKQSVTVGAQLLWGGRYGCNNGRYGCTIVMSYIEINKAVSQWLLTFNLCVSVTWPLTCAFRTPCTHTSEIIDMHRGVCDKQSIQPAKLGVKMPTSTGHSLRCRWDVCHRPQQYRWEACQIATQSEIFEDLLRAFESLWDLTTGRLLRHWSGPLLLGCPYEKGF